MSFANTSNTPRLTIKAIALVLKTVFKKNKIRYNITLRVKFEADLNDQPLFTRKLKAVAVTAAVTLDMVMLRPVTFLKKVNSNNSSAAEDPPTIKYFISCFCISLLLINLCILLIFIKKPSSVYKWIIHT